jgi:hypothetical protein
MPPQWPWGHAMAAKVFISYRRDDSAGHAGRIHDRLRGEFDRELLFMDVDAIPLGRNFITIVHEEIAKCDVLLALIGPNWLSAKNIDGKPRLEKPDDPVRVEIAAALQRDIPVIPILLDGATIPQSDLLPADIKELANRNGLDVRHNSFHTDMDRLVRELKTFLAIQPSPRDPRQQLSSSIIEQHPDHTRPKRTVATELLSLLGGLLVSSMMVMVIVIFLGAFLVIGDVDRILIGYSLLVISIVLLVVIVYYRAMLITLHGVISYGLLTAFAPMFFLIFGYFSDANIIGTNILTRILLFGVPATILLTSLYVLLRFRLKNQ